MDFKFKINKKCVGLVLLSSPCTYFQIRKRENTKIENWLDDDDQNDDNAVIDQNDDDGDDDKDDDGDDAGKHSRH